MWNLQFWLKLDYFYLLYIYLLYIYYILISLTTGYYQCSNWEYANEVCCTKKYKQFILFKPGLIN